MLNRRSMIRLGVILGMLPVAAMPRAAQADPPSLLSMFRKRSDTNGSVYQLKPEHGPWLFSPLHFRAMMASKRQKHSLVNYKAT